MKCSICDRQKNDLKPKQSVIMPKTKLLVCNDCLADGLEPRWIVALGARANVAAAKKFIVNKLYPGEEIIAREILG